MTREIPPISPGEMLLEEFLKPSGSSQYRLAKEIGGGKRMSKPVLLLLVLWSFCGLCFAEPTPEKLEQVIDAYLADTTDPVTIKYGIAMGNLLLINALDQELKKQPLGAGWNYVHPAWQHARTRLLETETAVYEKSVNFEKTRNKQEFFKKIADSSDLNDADCDEWLSMRKSPVGEKIFKIRGVGRRNALITSYASYVAENQNVNVLPVLIPDAEVKADLAQSEAEVERVEFPHTDEIKAFAKDFEALESKVSAAMEQLRTNSLAPDEDSENAGLLNEFVKQAVQEYNAVIP